LTGGRAGVARASAPARSIESITNQYFQRVRSWVNVDFTQRAEPTEILKALSTLQALRGF